MNESNPEIEIETEADRAFTYTRKTKNGKEDRRCILHKQQERIKTAIQMARQDDDEERISVKYEIKKIQEEKNRIEEELKKEREERERIKEELRQQLRDDYERNYMEKLQQLKSEAEIEHKKIYEVAFKDGLVKGKTNRIIDMRHTMACRF